jgi:hypothetical protein
MKAWGGVPSFRNSGISTLLITSVPVLSCGGSRSCTEIDRVCAALLHASSTRIECPLFSAIPFAPRSCIHGPPFRTVPQQADGVVYEIERNREAPRDVRASLRAVHRIKRVAKPASRTAERFRADSLDRER